MKRIQLFEFEDFDWLPVLIRNSITELIVVLHRLLKTKELLTGIINEIRQKVAFNKIVDLGSGSGGIMPEVVDNLNQDKEDKINLLLTDLYPNQKIVEEYNATDSDLIRYATHSVNAANLESTPEGLKTMLNSFHHMPPDVAKSILHSAQNNRTPIMIYELTENRNPLWLWWVLLPVSLAIVFIMALIMTPFTRRISFGRLFFTYIIPIIPLIYAWDGQASYVRIYTFSDIREMLLDIYDEGIYKWEMNKATYNGKQVGYYILGYPVEEK